MVFWALDYYWLLGHTYKDVAWENKILTNHHAKDRICWNMGMENIKLAAVKSTISAIGNAFPPGHAPCFETSSS